MLHLFDDMFAVEPIPDSELCLREPSTQVFTQAHKKVKLITDSEGTYPVSLWRVIYILACIHTYPGGKCGTSIASIFYKAFKKDDTTENITVEQLFNDVPDDEFIPFLEEVASAIPLSKAISWFKTINDKLVITDEKKTEVKND